MALPDAEFSIVFIVHAFAIIITNIAIIAAVTNPMPCFFFLLSPKLIGAHLIKRYPETEIIIAAPQISHDQRATFKPSREATGKRFIIAIRKEIFAEYSIRLGLKLLRAIRTTAATIFAAGPASAIIPKSFLKSFLGSFVFFSFMKTKLGGVRINPKKEVNIPIAEPTGQNFISALAPYLLAANLCPAKSCKNKSATTTANEIKYPFKSGPPKAKPSAPAEARKCAHSGICKIFFWGSFLEAIKSNLFQVMLNLSYFFR